MRMIDADELRIKPEYMHDICGVAMIRVEDVARIITEMPTIDPQPQWIPVSERLPEICEKDVNGMVTFSKQVWACQKYGDGFLWQAIDQYASFGGWLSEIPIDDPMERCEVVAWMPLPEPYKGE